MLPKRIILVRHAQSEGNVDPNKYIEQPDYTIELTNLGITQAKDTGIELKNLIGMESVGFYNSPFYRTRSTLEYILESFKDNKYIIKEDPRLREQEYCKFNSLDEMNLIKTQRDQYGTFFYRVITGESGADVYDRISTFLETLYRDFNTNTLDNVIIVSHGLTIKLFLMRFFHLSVEQFELMKTLKNAKYHVLNLSQDNKYILPKLEYWENTYHNYKYNLKNK